MGQIIDFKAVSQAPSHLSEAAQELYRSISDEYALADAVGTAILIELCQVYDRLQAVRREISTDGLVTKGSRKQPRAHPLLGNEAELQRLLLAHYRALNLEG